LAHNVTVVTGFASLQLAVTTELDGLAVFTWPGARIALFELTVFRATVTRVFVAIVAAFGASYPAIAAVDDFYTCLPLWTNIAWVLLTLVTASICRVEVVVVASLTRIFNAIAAHNGIETVAAGAVPVWLGGAERRTAVARF